jgi:membrane protease YdiL (CAAX protease family)
MLSWQQIALLLAPWVLLGTTYLCYGALKRRLAAPTAYLGGFLFYWVAWCIVLPLVVLGPRRLAGLFRPCASPLGHPWWLGVFCLVGPPLFSFATVFPGALRRANPKVWLASAAAAIVNGTLEEVLWRGTYIALFPDDFWLGQLYATVGFAVWHFSPQSVYPYRGPGGQVGLVVAVGFLGLLWAWVANNTGVILWTAISHILIDLSALGWPPQDDGTTG